MICLIVVLILLIIFLFKVNFLYKKYNYDLFYDLNFIFIVFSYFYISLPLIFYEFNEEIYSNFNEDIVDNGKYWGIYFIFIINILFLSKKEVYSFEKLKIKLNYILVYFILCFNILYIIAIFQFKFEEFLSITGKADAALLSYELDSYKLKALFNIQLVLTILLSISKKQSRYLAFLLPFIIVDLYLRNRFYIFSSVFSAMLVMHLNINKINYRYIIILILFISSFSIIRDDNPTTYFDNFVLLIGEFLYTWQSNYIILSSNDTIRLSHWVLNAISKNIYYFINGFHFENYKYILDKNNLLGFGVGGSIIAESLAFKNAVINILYPFFIYAYFYYFNRIKSRSTFDFILFVVIYVNMISFLRGDLMSMLFYNIYMGLILSPFYIRFFRNG